MATTKEPRETKHALAWLNFDSNTIANYPYDGGPMFSASHFHLCALSLLLNSNFAKSQGWTSLPVTVAVNITDLDYANSQVQVLFGTPPQPVDLTIGIGATLLSPWSSDCAICPSFTSFDPSRSSTLKPENTPWAGNSLDASGHWFDDTVGFGGLRAENVPFVLMEEMTTNYNQMLNGHLGIWANLSETRNNVFNQLWDQGALLDPVIGLRLDPVRPRMTVGALDPEDYEGVINWVPLGSEPSDPTAFRIDGIKGYSGSLIPFDGESLSATMNSIARFIYLPPTLFEEYFTSSDYYGPNVNPILQAGMPTVYECPDAENTLPPVPFTVTINGVDYPMEQPNNMIRQPSAVTASACRVSLINTTTADPLDVYLGTPFMRSVYVAYRFPTSDSDCPAYFGFAFPSGLNHSPEQINQIPRDVPTRSDQCLALKGPSGIAITGSVSTDIGSGSYAVYGEEGRQVTLIGADELKRR